MPRRSTIEQHRRYAFLYERAAASYAHELSTEHDPERREQLAAAAKRDKEAAASYRALADKLKGE